MQIGREIATMKLIKHPNVVQLYEVNNLSLLSLILINIPQNLCLDSCDRSWKLQMVLQVMASKTKIFIILEYVTGGELFDKIVS